MVNARMLEMTSRFHDLRLRDRSALIGRSRIQLVYYIFVSFPDLPRLLQLLQHRPRHLFTILNAPSFTAAVVTASEFSFFHLQRETTQVGGEYYQPSSMSSSISHHSMPEAAVIAPPV